MKGAARIQATARLQQRPPIVRGRITRALQTARAASRPTLQLQNDGVPLLQDQHGDDALPGYTPTLTMAVVEKPQ